MAYSILDNHYHEDIDDIIVKIEHTFNISFVANELRHIKDLGELCDFIVDKIQLNHAEGCTTQQAFYKIKNAVSVALNIDKSDITPHTALKEILPRRNRRAEMKKIETILGIKLSVLEPYGIVSATLAILFLLSLVAIFLSWKIGLSGLILAIAGIKLSNKFGKELSLNTIGDVAEKMTMESYMSSRRDSDTINRREIEKVVFDLFRHYLLMSDADLTREARFAK